MTSIRRCTRPATIAALLLTAGLTVGVPGSAQNDTGQDVFVIDDLMWTLGSNGESVAWGDASEYCETLELDGRGDWRLPTLAEVETLYDPAAQERGRIRSPFELEDCCVWSSTNLVELEAETKGVLPDPTNDPSGYYWGFLFPSGVRYYSFQGFPDGEALCVRNTRTAP